MGGIHHDHPVERQSGAGVSCAAQARTIRTLRGRFTHILKDLGFDGAGERCFYRHEFTLTEGRFDLEECPIEVTVFSEQVFTQEPGLVGLVEETGVARMELAESGTIGAPPIFKPKSGRWIQAEKR
jgi:hypothetical protein